MAYSRDRQPQRRLRGIATERTRAAAALDTAYKNLSDALAAARTAYNTATDQTQNLAKAAGSYTRLDTNGGCPGVAVKSGTTQTDNEAAVRGSEGTMTALSRGGGRLTAGGSGTARTPDSYALAAVPASQNIAATEVGTLRGNVKAKAESYRTAYSVAVSFVNGQSAVLKRFYFC